jgi:hypothetical protein
LSVLLLAPPLGAFIGSAGGAHDRPGSMAGARPSLAAVPGFLLAMLALAHRRRAARAASTTNSRGRVVPPLSAVLAPDVAPPCLPASAGRLDLASMVGFGLNAFLAAFLFRSFGYSVRARGHHRGLIASLPATLGVLGSGWLADRIARRDARPTDHSRRLAALGRAVYMLAVTRESAPAAIGLLALAATVQYSYLAPSQGVFQNLMHPRMRASSTATVLIFYSIVGAGLGPLLVGGLSDHFAPDASPAGSSAGCPRPSPSRRSLFLGRASFLPCAAADQGRNAPPPVTKKATKKGPSREREGPWSMGVQTRSRSPCSRASTPSIRPDVRSIGNGLSASSSPSDIPTSKDAEVRPSLPSARR